MTRRVSRTAVRVMVMGRGDYATSALSHCFASFLPIAGNSMSILNGVVAMNLAGAGYEGPSTPLRDPTSSPAVHIQWQNSQSACAAMEELRVASSEPRCGRSF